MRKIKIKPIISNLKDDAKEHFKDCLITFPSNTLVLGQSSSGKTTNIVNLILSPESGIIQFFTPKNIFVYAKKHITDDAWIYLKQKMEEIEKDWGQTNISKNLDIEILTKRYDLNMKIIEDQPILRKTKDTHVLFIIDDFITNQALQTKNNLFTEFFTLGRHDNVSSIVMAQDYTKLNDSIRKNPMFIMVHRVNGKELYLLSQEHGDKIGYKLFAIMYKASRGKSKKGFMLIRVHHDNDDYRFWDRYKYPFKIEQQEETYENI